jgi:hypothetical protein
VRRANLKRFMPLFHRPTASMRMSEGVDRMIPMTILTRCCIRGCTRGEAGEIGPRACEGICAEHWLLASAASRRLLRGAEARLEQLQRSWDDEEIFETIVARGRYLQFCVLIEAAHDYVDRARERVKAEIIGAARDLAGGPSIIPDDCDPSAVGAPERTRPASSQV